jgi:hypothetical protein
MILSDGEIARRLDEGDLVVEPLADPELQIQPASVDLRLGRTFLEFRHANIPCIHPDSEREVAEYVEETEVDEEPERTVVALSGEEPYEEVSVDIEESPWEVQSETDTLDAVSGFRDPRDPRPQLAEASPHSRAARREAASPESGPVEPAARTLGLSGDYPPADDAEEGSSNGEEDQAEDEEEDSDGSSRDAS